MIDLYTTDGEETTAQCQNKHIFSSIPEASSLSSIRNNYNMVLVTLSKRSPHSYLHLMTTSISKSRHRPSRKETQSEVYARDTDLQFEEQKECVYQEALV